MAVASIVVNYRLGQSPFKVFNVLGTGHTIVTIEVVYRCPNITKQNNEKIHNAISEVSKGD